MNAKKRRRQQFRSCVFTRDGFRCVVCRKAGYDRQGSDQHRLFHPDTGSHQLVLLDAHHITDRHLMPNGGYVVENGITLCDDGCHRAAEAFHETGIAIAGYSPDELYALIGSSPELAHLAAIDSA